MKKQIISLGALAVASSLFTWDNKADAIVTKDYSGKSQVKKESKNSASISDSIGISLNSALYYLEDYIIYAIGLTNKYE
ncbi:coagulase, partial [Staphylococcus aureus]|nr:coagulase [Staphylococcus aureus]